MDRSLRKQRREADRAEAAIPEPMVAVFVTTAVRTSGGNGPGPVRVPASEASALVNDRRAVYGDQPPRGFEDGGADTRDVARMMPRRA